MPTENRLSVSTKPALVCSSYHYSQKSKPGLYKDTYQLTNGGIKYSTCTVEYHLLRKNLRSFIICDSMVMEISVLNGGVQVCKHKYEMISFRVQYENVCWSNSG